MNKDVGKTIKAIAFYLPQFHPIPENNDWWGRGFTEWNNVVKGKPRFKNHYQPHLPEELGFYDLRLEETRLAQEMLAKEYGIHGFCYYHYWFSGKRLLNEPIDRKLKNPNEDLPFMLCWANENWTKVWDGGENEILIKQDYSKEDDLKHFNHLLKYFRDDRYIKIDDKPVFLIYRPKLFPDINKTIEIWRKEALKNDFKGLHLGYVQSWGVYDIPESMGFDFGVEFHPFSKSKVNLNFSKKINHFFLKAYNKLFSTYSIVIKKRKPDVVRNYWDYALMQMNDTYSKNISPCLTPMWDNSARRKHGALILKNSSPVYYKKWLNFILNNYPWDKSIEKFLFINAWNEWAEGNHLEPCQKWGRAYLEITKECLNNGK